jgi:hypothetical protein
VELLNSRISTIKDQISALPRTSHGKLKGISKILKRDIVEGYKYSGMFLKDYCKEIKISETLFYKCRKTLKEQNEAQSSGSGFQKIEIKSEKEEDKKEYCKRGVIVEGPGGLIVDGLEISEVIQLWRALC